MSDKNETARCDSKLKNLPVPLTRQIVEMKDEQGKSLADILTWLSGEHHISSNAASLSDALPFLRRKVRKGDREEAINEWLCEQKTQHPELTDEQLFAMGQRKFSLLSIADEDPESWVKIQSAAQGQQKIQLGKAKLTQDERRIILQEKKAAAYDRAQAALTTAKKSKGGVTPETMEKVIAELNLM